jgi:DNA-binding MarR family transcriptional regulator
LSAKANLADIFMKQDITHKIVVGLERISEAYKALLWEKAKSHNISPIQMQLLTFIDSHKIELCNVSYLAKEFNVTKPTVSDAVKVLHHKGFLEKDFSSTDSRSYNLFLSKTGKNLLSEIGNYFIPISNEINKLTKKDTDQLYSTLSQLIYQLNKNEVLKVQRICFGCNYYSQNNDTHHCNLIDSNLLDTDIRIDCPEFEPK